MKSNSQSKRTSGHHNGSQSQGNQRTQAMPDYQRQDNRNFNHMNRQPQQQPGAVPVQQSHPPQIAQVNMAPPPAMPQNISNIASLPPGAQPQHGRPTFIPSQQIPQVVNQPLTQHINPQGNPAIHMAIRQQQFSTYNPSIPAGIRGPQFPRMPNQQFTRPIGVPMLPPNQGMINAYPGPGQFVTPGFPNQFLPQFHSYYPNATSYIPVDQTQQQKPQAWPAQYQPPAASTEQKSEYKKRERKPAVVKNPDGTLVDLFSCSKKNESSSAASTAPVVKNADGTVVELISSSKTIESSSPIVVKNADGTVLDLYACAKKNESSAEPATSQSEQDAQAQTTTNINGIIAEEANNKSTEPEQSQSSQQQQQATVNSTDIVGDVENISDQTETHVVDVEEPATVTLAEKVNQCDNANAGDKTDVGGALAEKLSSIHLEDDGENQTDKVPAPTMNAQTSDVEPEPEVVSKPSQVAAPVTGTEIVDESREMTPSDEVTRKAPLLPLENVAVAPSSQNDAATSEVSSLSGPKIYNRDELIKIKDLSDSFPLEDHVTKCFPDLSRLNSSNPVETFLPNFSKARNGSGGDYRNRPNQMMNQNRRNPQGNKFQDRGGQRKNVSTSVPLVENAHYTPIVDAWKPDSLIRSHGDPNSTEAQTEKLLKEVRSILNKLTPQNYDDLLKQFKSLKIDTKVRLKRVIDRIFEKAVIEPAFVVQYAGFCSQLTHISVEDPDKEKPSVISFKNLLIKKCEETFMEKMYSDVENYAERMEEIENCQDPIKKKHLQDYLDDDKRYSRKRSVGNIKLIAELYKINILNSKIMIGCFMKLIQMNHEDYIECLCTLITNIGQTFLQQVTETDTSFKFVMDQLKMIQENKHPDLSVSSRVRFMILDLMDLKKNDWVPRRKTAGPKTIAQIHEDLEKEEIRKRRELEDMRRNKKMSTSSGPPAQTDGWSTVSVKKKGPQPAARISFSNLSMAGRGSLSSKPATAFAGFAQGSHGGGNSNSQSRSSSSNFEYTNKFSQLVEPKAYHESMSRPDRRDERKTSDVTAYQTRSESGTHEPARNSPLTQVSDAELTEEISKALSSFINGEQDNEDSKHCSEMIMKKCSNQQFSVFVSHMIDRGLEVSEPKRRATGKLLGYVLANADYFPSQIYEGLKNAFSREDDYDLPKFWEFVGVILAQALIQLRGDQKLKTNDILKQIGTAFGDVTGKNAINLSNGLTNELNYQKMPAEQMNEILHRIGLQKDSPNDVSNNSAKEFVDAYMATKGADPKKLMDEFKFENCDEKTKLDAVCLAAVQYTIEKFNAKQLESLYKEKKDELPRLLKMFPAETLLSKTAKLDKKMNYPIDLLRFLFTFYVESKVVNCDDVKKFASANPGLQASQLERLIKSNETK